MSQARPTATPEQILEFKKGAAARYKERGISPANATCLFDTHVVKLAAQLGIMPRQQAGYYDLVKHDLGGPTRKALKGIGRRVSPAAYAPTLLSPTLLSPTQPLDLGVKGLARGGIVKYIKDLIQRGGVREEIRRRV